MDITVEEFSSMLEAIHEHINQFYDFLYEFIDDDGNNEFDPWFHEGMEPYMDFSFHWSGKIEGEYYDKVFSI